MSALSSACLSANAIVSGGGGSAGATCAAPLLGDV
jgi:hypothetical protein